MNSDSALKECALFNHTQIYANAMHAADVETRMNVEICVALQLLVSEKQKSTKSTARAV